MQEKRAAAKASVMENVMVLVNATIKTDVIANHHQANAPAKESAPVNLQKAAVNY